MHERRRQQLTEWLVAALAGAALLLASNWLLPPPDAVPAGHPARFVAIAQAPFAFAGEFPHRILWPLLAHVAGWFGVGPIAFSQTCCAALLAVVFWFCRQRGASWLDAFLVAAAIAASGAVNVYKPLACQSDPLNLLLLVLTVHFVARPVLFWALVLLAALSHEMVFFFWPWLVWLRRREGGGSWTRDGAALALVLGLYAGWRLFVKAMAPAAAPGATYDAAYYIANNFWVPWGLPTLWGLWGLVVVSEFGPLLVLAALAWRRREPGLGGRAGQWLYAACVLSLMLLAYDVFRFASFVFLPVVLGGLALAAAPRGRGVLAAIVAIAAPLYAWRHPFPHEYGGRAYTEVATGNVFPMLGAYIDPTTGDFRHFAPHDGWSFPCELLARTWPAFAWAAAGALASIAAGWWLARYVGSASEAGSVPRTQRSASP